MSTLLICDSCRDRTKPAKRAEVRTGLFVNNPAGGPSTAEIRALDLCLDCAIVFLQAAGPDPGHVLSRDLEHLVKTFAPYP